jgi:hypothetical protein
MDLRQYYAKIRQLEGSLEGDFIVVVSCETPDGGRAGVASEVPRALAAKLIVEQQVRAATDEERREFHRRRAATRRKD